jgi:hypothetical protein
LSFLIWAKSFWQVEDFFVGFTLHQNNQSAGNGHLISVLLPDAEMIYS